MSPKSCTESREFIEGLSGFFESEGKITQEELDQVLKSVRGEQTDSDSMENLSVSPSREFLIKSTG